MRLRLLSALFAMSVPVDGAAVSYTPLPLGATSVELATGPAAGTVAVIAAGDAGRHPYVSASLNSGPSYGLSIRRSLDAGATWGNVVSLGSSEAGDVARGVPPVNSQMRRTAADTGVVAWTDRRHDTYAWRITDVYARASTNDGTSWDPEVRVRSSNLAVPSGARVTGLTAHGTNNAFLVWSDGRDRANRSANVHGDRSGLSLVFGADVRVDSDLGTVTPESGGAAASVAAEGVSRF